jgi:hypothetical protein
VRGICHAAEATVAVVILDRLELDPDALEARTGWALKPEGACKGDICVPLPNGPVDAAVLAERLRMPLLHDEAHGVWALGPDCVSGRALATAEAPDLALPDLEGNVVELSSLRGQKVLLAAWASW